MKYSHSFPLAVFVAACIAGTLSGGFLLQPRVSAAQAIPVGSSFHYRFLMPGILNEAGDMEDTWSPYWWVNSGAHLILENGIGRTVRGELPWYSKWRQMYAISNPIDTDNGYHPQNLFRLVTRSKWQNFRQDVRFRITDVNMSQSPERNGWSGVLLFNRYLNGENLYYAGLRMDGYAVVKKKMGGTYYTLSTDPVYVGSYDRIGNPNLIPQDRWIGLRSIVQNRSDGSVDIRVYVDKEDNGSWELVSSVTDDGRTYGGNALTQQGHAGIRTDFMDVQFDDYKAVSL